MKKRSLLVSCLLSFFMSTTFLSVNYVEAGELEALFYDSGNYLLEEIGVGLALPEEGGFSSVTRRSIQSAMDAGYDFQELMDNMLNQNAYAILTSDFEGGEYTCLICGTDVSEQNIVDMSEEAKDLLREGISEQLEKVAAQDIKIDEYHNPEFDFITATYNTVTDDVYPSKMYVTLFNGYQIWLQLDSHTPGTLPFEVESAFDGVVDSVHVEGGEKTSEVTS